MFKIFLEFLIIGFVGVGAGFVLGVSKMWTLMSEEAKENFRENLDEAIEDLEEEIQDLKDKDKNRKDK